MTNHSKSQKAPGVLLSIMLMGTLLGCASTNPPMIPIGLDAYRLWGRWPYQRIGARAYMRSTYDRSGGNETADAAHFLYQESENFNVTLDVQGPGILYFARYNHWHGSPWHYEVDGTDHIVQETTTADPTRKLDHSVFIPEELFPTPLTWTYAVTKGADLMWVPISFEQRFRMAYSRTFYGTGYYIYHKYVDGANLSRPIRSWDGRTPPDPAGLDLLNKAGTDIAPKLGTPLADRIGLTERNGTLNVPAGATVDLPNWTGPKVIRAINLSIPAAQAPTLQRARIRMTWDDRPTPSVDAPVALFFGTGTFYNRDDREYLIKAFPMNVRYGSDGRVYLACYFPMPFFKSAKIELVGNDQNVSDLRWSVRTARYNGPPNHVGYFHATYTDVPTPQRGHDIVCLNTVGLEGSTDWSGQFVGMTWIFTHRNVLNTLEGDPRFFFDDAQTPQCYGTGTEEWGGGGDYWGGRNMTLPLAGHPVGAPKLDQAKNQEDQIHSAYRFLLADLMPFGKNARIQLEHGGRNESTEHYETVAYWYGLPSPSLIKTDTLDVGDSNSERAHDYLSPDASDPYSITSRYEWGVDHLETKSRRQEIYPAHTQIGRTTPTESTFTLRIRPDNDGVMLRRTLDYQFPNQRARVYVADAHTPSPRFEFAGTWYLAGSNTCYHSYPSKKAGGELGKSNPVIQTSNRRFRDDEFLLPLRLTRNRRALRIKIEFFPVDRPLLPGQNIPPQAWSEIQYDAYTYTMPKSPI